MNIEAFREYCLQKRGTTEELPFDEDTLVFKVCGKMFALCSIEDYHKGIAVKCDPDKAIELREKYAGRVTEAYHMSKTHWNAVLPESGLPDELIKAWIDDSYLLVVAKLPKKVKLELGLA